mmetsp:Transcript_25635/g.48179  ORF Transcript_25635/g.48179 Transcript_25635/m.48179 type:complete len:202 (+) Transcript_25635:1201-1806(+)
MEGHGSSFQGGRQRSLGPFLDVGADNQSGREAHLEQIRDEHSRGEQQPRLGGGIRNGVRQLGHSPLRRDSVRQKQRPEQTQHLARLFQHFLRRCLGISVGQEAHILPRGPKHRAREDYNCLLRAFGGAGRLKGKGRRCHHQQEAGHSGQGQGDAKGGRESQGTAASEKIRHDLKGRAQRGRLAARHSRPPKRQEEDQQSSG